MHAEIYLLNIHTTGESAMVNLSLKDTVLETKYNYQFKEHASFLHTAIDQLLGSQNINPTQLKAIGVTHGPGSYTGIRVGLAAAKGLCFSLNIPLIMLNTLEVMAETAIRHINDPAALYSPMIDARRMEVYTALYAFDKTVIEASQPVILEENFLKKYRDKNNVYFFGSGSNKFQQILLPETPHSLFEEVEADTEALAKLCYANFISNNFSDLAFSEPLYLKEFQSTSKQ